MKKEFSVARSFAGRVGAIAGAGVIAMTVWVGLGGSMGAASFVPELQSCLPTCDVDGRHLVVAGDDNTTLAAQAITIGLVFTEESLEANGNFSLYDADRDPANWDVEFNDGTDPIPDADAPELIIELWADPNGNGAEGAGATLVNYWSPDVLDLNPLNLGPFPAVINDWAPVSFPHTDAALEDGVNDGSGIFQYALRILPYLPLEDKGWNAFKVRAFGTVTLPRDQVVGFIASLGTSESDFDAIYPTGNLTPTPYDGSWVFKTNLPAGLSDVTVFDGDMDFGNARFVDAVTTICDYKDSDDEDTPATPPGFANAAALPEGVAHRWRSLVLEEMEQASPPTTPERRYIDGCPPCRVSRTASVTD